MSTFNLKKLLSFALLIGTFSGLFAQVNYLPAKLDGDIISHTYYTLSYNEAHEQAEWVAYKLTANMIGVGISRTDDFRPDVMISTGSAQLSDYKGSGYDRGHLCPAGDMVFSQVAMSESFFMSNMSPQNPSFNRGIWKKLESLVRSWAVKEGEVYVVTGPILSVSLGSIGANAFTIPKYYYKVVFDYREPEQKMIALILPNEKSQKDLESYVVSVDDLEGVTGIDFFPELDDDVEEELESVRDLTAWSFVPSAVSTSIIASESATNPSTVKTIGGSTQCMWKAKSTSNRCKNKTTKVNGYCYLLHNQAPGYVKPKSTGSSPEGR